MAVGNWIYERTNTTGSGSGPPPAGEAPAVIITDRDGNPCAAGDSACGYDVKEKQDGQVEVQVFWKKAANATDDNFRGAQVYLEDPDLSNLEKAPLNGTVKLDGTSQSSGAWKPVHESDSFLEESETVGIATVTVAAAEADRPIRVYLLAFGRLTNPQLHRANRANETPSIRATIPKGAGQYVSGVEYSWNVTNAAVTTVTDFENPKGPLYHLVFDFTAPNAADPLPPGLKPFAGVQIVYEYDDGHRAQGPFLQANKPETWISDDYPISEDTHFKVWFCAADVDGRVNTIKKGVTPMVDVNIYFEALPDIADFTATNSRNEAQPDGTMYALVDLTWTNPDTSRYAGISIYRVDKQPPRLFGYFPNPMTKTTLSIIDWPKIPENWTLAAITVDFNGQPGADPTKPLPSHIPTAVWTVGPPGTGSGGREYTPIGDASGMIVTTEQELGSDGIVRMRHKITGWTNPTDNTFGGMSIARVYGGDLANATYWDAPKGATSYTTDWEPAPTARAWDFYIVSRDMQNHRNTISPGYTPKVTVNFSPMAGDVIVSRLPKGWWNEDEFSWPDNGLFQADQFVAKKIYVGSILRVGGGSATGTTDPSFAGQQNGQIAVYNYANQIRAWMGQQNNTAAGSDTPHTVFGGWFAELYVGGDDPSSAPIYVNQAGRVVVGGWDVKVVAGKTQYPYISVQRNDGVEVGRIGARIGDSLVSTSDPAYIGGAWFREFACGGSNLSDWRILARRDPTNAAGGDLFNIRNVAKFTIDYIQNYPTATNPTNAAMQLSYGYDAYVADSTNNSYYKFPGLKLVRSVGGVPGTHGITIINRGLVIWDPSGYKMASLVSYNGDDFGSDNPAYYWGVLQLYSPTRRTANVVISSGAASNDPNTGSAYMNLLDQNGNISFSVGPTGNATVRGQLSSGSINTGAIVCTTVQGSSISCSSLTSTGALNGNSLNIGSGGQAIMGYIPNNLTVSGVVQCQSVNIGAAQVINTSGAFVGAGVNCPNNGVAASGFNPYVAGTGQFFGIAFDTFTVGGKTYVIRGGVLCAN